jgi:hypothetical protein
MVTGAAWCAPFVPDDDADVLETLPVNPREPALREVRALRARLAQQPDDVALASEVARRYVEIGRVTGDPRYAGYAQAVLARWWESVNPPRDVLLLRASLRQRVHAFDPALADLKLAIARNPRDAQALLTRATILLVRGELDSARRDCSALRAITQEAIWAACLYGVEAHGGRLAESYRSLRATLERSPPLPAHIRAWLLTGLAEMAVRGGWRNEARAHFKAALRADGADPYLLAAYADLLLDEEAPAHVLPLLSGHLRADGLLLRYVLALDAVASPETDERINELRVRFQASGMRGERVHLREEARFSLQLLKDASTALALAKRNWAIQKEPADATILVQAALAAGDTATLDEMRSWVAATRFEDVQLARLLRRENPAR